MLRATQLSLLLAGVGAVAIMTGLFGSGVEIAGLVAIALGTVLAAPAGRCVTDPPPGLARAHRTDDVTGLRHPSRAAALA